MSTESRHQIASLFVVKQKPTDSERSFLSQSTMFAGFVSLTWAMLGGIWLIGKVFDTGLMNNLDMALVALLPIGLAYLAGWIFSLLSIRAYNNLVFPLVIRSCAWFILAGALVLYLKVIQKLFTQGYGFSNFLAYIFILIGVLLALFGLHLLPEEHDLRPYSIPIFLVGLFHLWTMISRYVFFPIEGHGAFIFGDIFIFAMMQAIAGLMMAHTGVFNPLRESIADFFRDRGKMFH